MLTYLYFAGSLLLISVLFLFLKTNSIFKNISLDLGLGGIIYGGMVAIYSLILAFVVVVGWQQYQITGDRIEAEASKLASVYRSTFAFSDTSTSRAIRSQIKNYITSVQKEEWPAMNHDTLSGKTQKYADDIWYSIIHNIHPSNDVDKVWYTTAVQSMNQFSEARHFRLSDLDTSIPSLMWTMLISGAVLIILFSILLGSENKWHQFLKVMLLSIMITFSLLLVYALDHPFKGVLKLEPAAFQKINVGEDML